MKKCRICKQEKALELFYKDKSRNDGYRQCCKVCDSTLVLNRIRKNREELNDTHWRLLGRKHNIEGTKLKDKFLSQKARCFYCKVKLKNGFHIEHFYPKSQPEIVIACEDCNRLKWKRNGKEFQLFLKEYISRFL